MGRKWSAESFEEALKAALSVSVAPQVKATHVQMIMDRARELAGPQIVATPAHPQKSRLRRFALRTGIALGLVGALVAPAAAFASSAQPGDTLYGTKLAIEKVQLAMASGPVADAQLHIRFAAKRLSEIDNAGSHGRKKGLETALANLNEHLAGAEADLAEAKAEGKDTSAADHEFSTVRMHHVLVLSGVAARAGCGTLDSEGKLTGGDPSAAPQCKGLLNAITNSSKHLDFVPPGQGGENPGKGTQTSEERRNSNGTNHTPPTPATSHGKPSSSSGDS
jgi:hypothetical protein